LEVTAIRRMVSDLRERGIGVLITDHNVQDTLRTTTRAYIMSEGRIITEGSPAEIAADPQAREQYLGPDFQLTNRPAVNAGVAAAAPQS